MTTIYCGIAVAIFQCLVVLTLAGKYTYDRERLPRAWAKAAPVDPNLPIRGRYVTMRLEVSFAPGMGGNPAQLSAKNGQLVGTPDNSGAMLSEPVAFFLPEHASDPSRRHPGEELWVEVSVPRKGPPRPIRLGVKKNGVLTPLP
jgi:hypothetical protein